MIIYAIEEFEEPFEGCYNGGCATIQNEISIMKKCQEKGFDGISGFSSEKEMKFTCVMKLEEIWYDKNLKMIKHISYYEN